MENLRGAYRVKKKNLVRAAPKKSENPRRKKMQKIDDFTALCAQFYATALPVFNDEAEEVRPAEPTLDFPTLALQRAVVASLDADARAVAAHSEKQQSNQQKTHGSVVLDV